MEETWKPQRESSQAGIRQEGAATSTDHTHTESRERQRAGRMLAWPNAQAAGRKLQGGRFGSLTAFLPYSLFGSTSDPVR